MKLTNFNYKLILIFCFTSLIATTGSSQDNLEVDGRSIMNRNGEVLRLNGANNWMSFWNGVTYNGYLQHTGSHLNLMNVQEGPLTLGTNFTERMRITEDGQVGIGTISPDDNQILHVTGGYMKFEPEFDGVGTGYIQMGINFSGTPYMSWHDGTEERIALSATGSSRIVGNLAVGELSAGDYALKVTHGPGDKGINIVNGDGPSDNDWEFWSSPITNGVLRLYNNDMLRGSFNGTSGVYTPVSDRRLKKNIENLESVLDKVMQLQPTRYQLIDNNPGDEKTIGFIAQDVEKVFPEFVFKVKDERDLGTYTLDYTGFGILAIKAVQEQQVLIQSLQKDNQQVNNEKAALEQRVSSLEEKLDELINQISENK